MKNFLRKYQEVELKKKTKKFFKIDGQVSKKIIIFDNNTIMIFMIKSDLKDIFEFDWENAQMEFQKEIEKENGILKEENEKK